MAIKTMGKFTAIGMRTKVADENALIINTCGRNDTAEIGTATSWVWSNPTNRVLTHRYHDIEAVSVEALWQGTKITKRTQAAGHGLRPDPTIIAGDWRKGKGKRPIGAYAGPGQPLITTPGEARRAIYLPAFERLIRHGLRNTTINRWIRDAIDHDGPVSCAITTPGRGVDRNGPMSHAWVLATFLNTGEFPR